MAISSISASSSVASSFGTSRRHSSKLSWFSSASQLPLQLKPNRLPKSWISSPSGHSRILTKVSAKKQSFANLEELLENAEKPVLVDFYATWCGPCQLMVPILEEVGSVLTDTIQVVKIDTEKYVSIANQYDIQGCLLSSCSKMGSLSIALRVHCLKRSSSNAYKAPST